MKKATTLLSRSLLVLIISFLGSNSQAFAQTTNSPLDLGPDGIQVVPIAIPAFIGYTEKAMQGNESLINVPTTINSLEEYQQLFGGAPSLTFELINSSATISNRYYLFESIKLFYENGGGTCYVISVGNYDNPIAQDDLAEPMSEQRGALFRVDKATMVVIPDAVSLRSTECHKLYYTVLKHCLWYGHRIGLFDVHGGFSAETHEQNVASFRGAVASDTRFLKYGVAYYPWVRVNIVEESTLSFNDFENGMGDLKKLARTFEAAERDQVLQLINNLPPINTRDRDAERLEIENNKELHQRLLTISPGYQQVIKEMSFRANLLPVSGLVAGFFARADKELGTWMSTYDIPLKGVLEPAVPLSANQQKQLRIDPVSGKSINPIATDPEKGVLIMGSRTLAGNDSEYRHVSVKRTKAMIEKSLEEAITNFRKTPDHKGPIERREIKAKMVQFLTALWEKGVLDGASMEGAFSIKDDFDLDENNREIKYGLIQFKVKYSVASPITSVSIRFDTD